VDLTTSQKATIMIVGLFLAIAVLHLAVELIMDQEEMLRVKQGIIDQLQKQGPMKE